MVEAKAKARGLRGRGQGQIISDQGHVCLWNSTRLVRLHRSTPYCHSSVLTPQSFAISIINHTQKFNVLRPDLLKAKSKAAHRRGQEPRPGVFEAKATKFCPRGVLGVEASPRGPHPRKRNPNETCKSTTNIYAQTEDDGIRASYDMSGQETDWAYYTGPKVCTVQCILDCIPWSVVRDWLCPLIDWLSRV